MMMMMTMVNNLPSYHKSSAQLCHQELVEKLQHFKNFYVSYGHVMQRGFKQMARNIIFILRTVHLG